MKTKTTVPTAAMSQSQSHDMWTKNAITPACRATSSGCSGSRRRANGLPTIAATKSTTAADEERQADHAELAEHVEPLAVRVLDHAAALAEAVVREGERARRRCRRHARERDWRAASRQSGMRPLVVSVISRAAALPPPSDSGVGDQRVQPVLDPRDAAVRLDVAPGAADDDHARRPRARPRRRRWSTSAASGRHRCSSATASCTPAVTSSAAIAQRSRTPPCSVRRASSVVAREERARGRGAARARAPPARPPPRA